jgi:hypothetical protein
MKINSQHVAEFLEYLLDEYAVDEFSKDENSEGPVEVSIRSFESAGVLTNNAGFVVAINGREFQVSVVRSN